MSSPAPMSVREVMDELQTTRTIPALDGNQMAMLSEYLYKLADTAVRFEIAEIGYLNHHDPQALDVFLSCTIPIARTMSERKAYRIFVHPSDWQFEAMLRWSGNGSADHVRASFSAWSTPQRIPALFAEHHLARRTAGLFQAF
jgi:hypothetical protein